MVSRKSKLNTTTFEKHGIYCIEDAREHAKEYPIELEKPLVPCGIWFKGRKECPSKTGCCLFKYYYLSNTFGIDAKELYKHYKCPYSNRKIRANLIKRKHLILYNSRW